MWVSATDLRLPAWRDGATRPTASCAPRARHRAEPPNPFARISAATSSSSEIAPGASRNVSSTRRWHSPGRNTCRRLARRLTGTRSTTHCGSNNRIVASRCASSSPSCFSSRRRSSICPTSSARLAVNAFITCTSAMSSPSRLERVRILSGGPAGIMCACCITPDTCCPGSLSPWQFLVDVLCERRQGRRVPLLPAAVCTGV